MSGDSFFAKFPTISYNGQNVVDITERVVLTNTPQNSPLLFHPFTLPDGMRPDTLAGQYYSDSYRDWLVWMSNGTMDPYYDWPVTDELVDELTINDYGTIATAQRTILYFDLNWDTDLRILSPALFAALPPEEQKYWQPNYSYGNNIANYTRRQDPWKCTTNYVQSLTVNTAPIANVVGQIVSLQMSGVENGYAAVNSWGNSSTLVVQHVIGDPSAYMTVMATEVTGQPIPDETVSFQASNGVVLAMGSFDSANGSTYVFDISSYFPFSEVSDVVFVTSGALVAVNSNTVQTSQAVFANTSVPYYGSNTILQSIPLAEATYWQPVDAYTKAYDENAGKKNVSLIDAAYAQQTSRQLKTLLNG